MFLAELSTQTVYFVTSFCQQFVQCGDGALQGGIPGAEVSYLQHQIFDVVLACAFIGHEFP